MSSNTLNSFKKYDLLIFSDDILNSKVVSYSTFKIPYFIFHTHGEILNGLNGNKEDTAYPSAVTNLQHLIDDGKINQNAILEKILSFANEPINYLKFSERKEVMRVRRRKNILFSLKFMFIGMAGFFAYYMAVKRFNLFNKS